MHRIEYIGVHPVRAKLVAMVGTRFQYTISGEEKIHTSRMGGYGYDLAKCAAKLNDNHAESLEADARNITAYVCRQKDRVNNWKPMPLIPLKKGE